MENSPTAACRCGVQFGTEALFCRTCGSDRSGGRRRWLGGLLGGTGAWLVTATAVALVLRSPIPPVAQGQAPEARYFDKLNSWTPLQGERQRSQAFSGALYSHDCAALAQFASFPLDFRIEGADSVFSGEMLAPVRIADAPKSVQVSEQKFRHDCPSSAFFGRFPREASRTLGPFVDRRGGRATLGVVGVGGPEIPRFAFALRGGSATWVGIEWEWFEPDYEPNAAAGNASPADPAMEIGSVARPAPDSPSPPRVEVSALGAMKAAPGSLGFQGTFHDEKSHEVLVIGSNSADRISLETLQSIVYRAGAGKPNLTLEIVSRVAVEGVLTVRFQRSPKLYVLTYAKDRGSLTCKNPDGTVQTFVRVQVGQRAEVLTEGNR